MSKTAKKNVEAIIGNLLKVRVKDTRFDNYYTDVIDEKEYLMAEGKQDNDIFIEYEGIELFKAITGLVVPPLPAALKSKDKALMEKAVPEKRIFKFCKKFGMPYEEGEPGNYIELEHFRYRVAWLYSLFEAWSAMISGHASPEIDLLLKRHSSIVDGSKVQRAKKALAAELNIYGSIGTQLFPDYSSTKDEFYLVFYSTDLIKAAYFQFFSIVTVNPLEIEARIHLKLCQDSDCGSLFWGRGNSKFCFYCDRRIAYKKKNGGKKK